MKIVIIGVGEVGFNLAKILSLENHDITVIDSDKEKCEHANEQLDVEVIEGTGASAVTLDSAGVKDADIVVAASDIDEVNIVVSMMTRKLSNAKTVARVRNHEYSSENPVISAEQLGIDLMIHPEQEVARNIVQLVRQASATDTMMLADEKLQMIGIRITNRTAPAVGKKLMDLGLEYPDVPFRITAIARRNKTLVPTGDDWVQFNDQLYIIAASDSVDEVLKLMGKEDEKLEDVMILGGGKIGRLVAEMLEDTVSVKLIETDKLKSQKIADQLSKTLVISGDGTDIDLLAREDIMNMDCYIALTQDDENNV
ncbi:Trk system potassium transporter TrkA, partial [candidate division KSB1 bacterium]